MTSSQRGCSHYIEKEGGILADKDKEKRIKKEIRRIKSFLTDLDEDTINSAKSLIENAAFMTITLEDLQGLINKNGPISEYQNGANQWGTKKSPEIEIYNTMVKNHMAIMRQLVDLLPKDSNTIEDDGFEKFLSAR